MIRIAGLALLVLVQPAIASAAKITVLCSNGFRAVMQELAPEFERLSGHQVVVTYSVSAELKKLIDHGQFFDIAILTPTLIDDLIKAQRVDHLSRAVLARSAMALAIRSGSTKPDLASVAALTTTLRTASSIAFAREGAGGVFFTGLVERLGLTALLTPKFKPVTTGQDVSQAVARGEAQFGVLPLSEILSAPDVDLAGTFPPSVQDYAVMVGAVSAEAARLTAAHALLRFLMSPAASPMIQIKGMERVPPT